MTLAKVVTVVLGVLNNLVWLLGSAAVVIFLWGVVRYIYFASAGSKQVKQSRKTMLWSFIALFVIFSVWGILRFACASLGNVCTGSPGNGVACDLGTCTTQFLQNGSGLY